MSDLIISIFYHFFHASCQWRLDSNLVLQIILWSLAALWPQIFSLRFSLRLLIFCLAPTEKFHLKSWRSSDFVIWKRFCVVELVYYGMWRHHCMFSQNTVPIIIGFGTWDECLYWTRNRICNRQSDCDAAFVYAKSKFQNDFQQMHIHLLIIQAWRMWQIRWIHQLGQSQQIFIWVGFIMCMLLLLRQCRWMSVSVRSFQTT